MAKTIPPTNDSKTSTGDSLGVGGYTNPGTDAKSSMPDAKLTKTVTVPPVDGNLARSPENAMANKLAAITPNLPAKSQDTVESFGEFNVKTPSAAATDLMSSARGATDEATIKNIGDAAKRAADGSIASDLDTFDSRKNERVVSPAIADTRSAVPTADALAEDTSFVTVFELDDQFAVRVNGVTSIIGKRHELGGLPAVAVMQATAQAINKAYKL